MDKKRFGGLLPLKEDDRDLRLGGLVVLPPLSELPKKYSLPKPKIKDQEQSDFCGMFSSYLISEFQEEVELAPEWGFAMAKKIDNSVDEWGIDLRTVCKTHTDCGAIEAKDAPFSIKTHEADFLRRIENWPDSLQDKALYHKKKGYARISGPYDAFDNIRASLWKFRDEKRGVFTGVIWSWDLDEVYLKDFSTNGEGHAIAIIGWEGDYLIVANSWGTEAGKDGFHYISRKVVNKFVDMYGAFMFIDLTKEEADEYLKYGRKLNPIKVSLMQTILNLANKLVEILKKKDMNKPEINDLLPLVKRKTDEFIKLASKKGYTLRVTSGFRTIAEQNSIYAQGRTKPGKIVTNAKGGQSLHNYGVAIDIVDRYKGYNLNWNELGALGESLGFEWGGRWSNFVDKPHFELTLNYTLGDFMTDKVDYSRYV